MSSLRLIGISKTFAENGVSTRAVDDLSLSLESGTMTFLVGPNGSGKTSLLRLIAGDLTIDRGLIEATIDNVVHDWTSDAVQSRAPWLARIWQDPKLGSVGDLTVEENLRLSTLSGAPRPWRRAITRANHDAIDLGEHGLARRLGVKAATLSGGQRQLLALEMAAARRARILLMDEPTASLDGLNAQDCMRRAGQFAENGAIVLVVTHDLNLAASFGDRLLVLQGGRLTEDMAGAAKAMLSAIDILKLATDPVLAGQSS